MDIYTKAALGLAGKNNAQLAQITTPSNTVATLAHTQNQTELIKSLPVGALDGVVDNFEIRGLSLVNLVYGFRTDAEETVSFPSVVGAKYYDSLNGTILTGTGSSMTVTNASGETADMMIIPMTVLGIADYTEAQMSDLVRGGWFYRLKGVENVEVKTVGKNLFDKHTSGRGYFVEVSTGNHLPDSDSFVSESIEIKGNTAYTITLGLQPVRVCYFDHANNFLSGVLLNDPATATAVSFTSPPAAKMLMFSVGQVASLDILQLEEGAVATPYESYKSSRLVITPTLRSLPNGVHDKVYAADGQVRQDMNVDELVLQSEDIVSEDTVGYSNVDLYFTSEIDDWLFEVEPDGNTAIVEGFTYLAEDADDSSAFFTYRNEGTSAIVFRVPKGTYANLAAAQAALAGTVIHFQLPTTELNNLTEARLATGELQSFTNGTVYLEVGGSRALSVSFDVPTSTGAVIQSLVESSNAQAKALATIVRDLEEMYNVLFPEESDAGGLE